MRKALALGTAAASLAGLAAFASPAAAEDTTVTATVTSVAGGRTLTVTSAPSVAAVDGVMVGSMLVTVDEALATGVDPWYVTAEVTDDLTRTGGTETISKAALSTTSNTVASTGVLGQTVTGGPAGNFSATRELMRVTGQSTSASYTNVYSITTGLSLTLPSGTLTGEYKAPMTVTLWQ